MIASQIPAKLVATVPPSERQNKGQFMTRILLLGLDPETVDYSEPALPRGMTAEKVRAGIAIAREKSRTVLRTVETSFYTYVGVLRRSPP